MINYTDYLNNKYILHTTLDDINCLKTNIGFFNMSIRDEKFCEICCFIEPFEELVWTNDYQGFVCIHNLDVETPNTTDLDNLFSKYNNVSEKLYYTNTDNYETGLIQYEDGVAMWFERKETNQRIAAIFYKDAHQWKDNF